MPLNNEATLTDSPCVPGFAEGGAVSELELS